MNSSSRMWPDKAASATYQLRTFYHTYRPARSSLYFHPQSGNLVVAVGNRAVVAARWTTIAAEVVLKSTYEYRRISALPGK